RGRSRSRARGSECRRWSEWDAGEDAGALGRDSAACSVPLCERRLAQQPRGRLSTDQSPQTRCFRMCPPTCPTEWIDRPLVLSFLRSPQDRGVVHVSSSVAPDDGFHACLLSSIHLYVRALGNTGLHYNGDTACP